MCLPEPGMEGVRRFLVYSNTSSRGLWPSTPDPTLVRARGQSVCAHANLHPLRPVPPASRLCWRPIFRLSASEWSSLP